MDPEAVVEAARGEVDETLLAGTRDGILGRSILADAPLVDHLDDDETLHYLLSGPAAPTRTTANEAEQIDAKGSYLTLLAVTDTRVLVVVGSEDGDRRFSFPYGDLVEVDLERGLLTTTVVLEVGPDERWRVEAGSGSNARDAVAYARERLSGDDGGETHASELVDVVFRSLVVNEETLSVQQYGPADLDALVADIEAHRDRLERHLADDEQAAARGAAATVDALGAEGERLAEATGDGGLARRVAAIRREARRAVVADVFDVGDPSALGDALDGALERLLCEVDPDAFERLVADVWDALGYQTAVTSSSRDRGVDVVGRRSTPVEQTVLIQAKRYAPDRTVGREAIQQYASLRRQEPEADIVVVVTTAGFTEPAVEAATELNVKLVDGDRLVEILDERGLYDVVASHAGV